MLLVGCGQGQVPDETEVVQVERTEATPTNTPSPPTPTEIPPTPTATRELVEVLVTDYGDLIGTWESRGQYSLEFKAEGPSFLFQSGDVSIMTFSMAEGILTVTSDCCPVVEGSITKYVDCSGEYLVYLAMDGDTPVHLSFEPFVEDPAGTRQMLLTSSPWVWVE